MNINNNIETWMSSLRKMCLVSVTQNILETARRNPSTTSNPKSIASKAAEMVTELDLPQMLNTEIVVIIRPVMEEMLGWYERYGDVTRAILTPHGTVDWTKSARAIVASPLPVYQRYVTACENCLEDDIFNLGKQVTSVMLRERSNPLADFWYDDVYGGNFDVKILSNSLSQEQVVKGWFLAVRHSNISGLRNFQEKATLKSIQVILNMTWNSGIYHPKYLSLTPALCNICLHDNVMDGEWLEGKKGNISHCLLLLLIEWPYQHLFMENAQLLMQNLSNWHFWYITMKISKKLFADYKDYDYKSLFVTFWNLGLTSFQSKLLVDGNVESTIHFLLLYLILVMDEFLVSLVFDQILLTEEDAIGSKFILSSLCYNLFRMEVYESIEFLMRISRAKYLKLFLKFKNDFNSEHEIQAVPPVRTYSRSNTYVVDKNDIFFHRYVQFLSKYWFLPELE